jgi:xylulokinase
VDGAFRTMIGAQPGTWLLETDLKGGTFTLNWLVERLIQPGATDQDKHRLLATLEAEAGGLPPGAQGLTLLPYWCGVMNPYWDDDASGVILGWRERHGRAHLYRAALEGLALEQRLHTEGVQAATAVPIERLVLMGGGSRSDLWCQVIADVTGRQVQRAGHAEATSLGAAVLAALGAGLYPDTPGALAQMTHRTDVFSPGEHAVFYGELFDIYRGLYPALSSSMHRLAALLRTQEEA